VSQQAWGGFSVAAEAEAWDALCARKEEREALCRAAAKLPTCEGLQGALKENHMIQSFEGDVSTKTSSGRILIVSPCPQLLPAPNRSGSTAIITRSIPEDEEPLVNMNRPLSSMGTSKPEIFRGRRVTPVTIA
jgi:hypothetical protein